MLSGSYDIPSSTLSLVFSEAVQASSVPAAEFTTVGSTSGTRPTAATGALSSSAFQDFPTTGGAQVGLTATVSSAAGPLHLVSTATGLPLTPFSGLVVPRSS